MAIQIRDYQDRVLSEDRRLLAAGTRAILNVIPTGGGKTFTACWLMQVAAHRENRTLAAMHRQELVMQWSMSLAALGQRHYLIAPKSVETAIRIQHVKELGRSFVDPASPAGVGSIQTIGRRLSSIQPPGIVLPDEAHHASAGTWLEVLNYWREARVVGWTATPCRADGLGLGVHAGGIFDEMVIGPTVPELIEWGNLVPARVFGSQHKLGLTGSDVGSTGDYKVRALREAIAQHGKTITGDAVKQYTKLCPGARAVVFCVSIEHARDVAADFCAAGYKFASIDGEMEDGERRRLTRALASGEIQGLTSCDLISEGFDLPAIEVAILLRPTQSESLYLQQVGRALRPFPGKSEALILDQVDNWLIHGFPDEVREWTLDGKSRGRKAANDNERPTAIQACPKCSQVQRPAPCCKFCGYVFPVVTRDLEVVDGDLVEITAEQAAAIRQQRSSDFAKARDLDSLKAAAKKHGYSEKYAHHLNAARERKEAAHADLKSALREWIAETGQGAQEVFGITIGDVVRMSERTANENAASVRAKLEEFRIGSLAGQFRKQAGLSF